MARSALCGGKFDKESGKPLIKIIPALLEFSKSVALVAMSTRVFFLCGVLIFFVLTGLVNSVPVVEAGDYFNPNAVELNGPQQTAADLQRFTNLGGQVPGTYRVDIYVNDNRFDTQEVTFVDRAGELQPQLTPAQLDTFGVRLDAYPDLKKLPLSTIITDVGDYIPSASSVLIFDKQRLNVSIPQLAMKVDAQDYIDPGLWDQGLPVLIFNYGYSGSNNWSHQDSGASRSSFLNLRSGANMGAWRLRNYSTYSDDGQGEKKWASINTYVQRDIQSLKSQLTLGESYTSGQVFDSVQFQGAQLASDDNMLPDSLRGFAPVIRGIAESNAQVTVRQNGYIIYQAYVAPGAFAISDLYPTSSSGDLEVTIKEANGSERRFVQPFSAVPNMVREGQLKYTVTAGRYRSQMEGARTPEFAQGTLTYGLPLGSTVYSGVLSSPLYSSAVIGLSHGFGDFGSLSFDVTQANTKLGDRSQHRGNSYRMQYAKDIQGTGTSFTLAGYRYATQGFYSFQEANEIDAVSHDAWRVGYNKRSKTQLSISQSLSNYGNLYVSGYQQDYWAQKGYERSLSSGYNISHKGINYSLNYSYIQSAGNNSNDQQVSVSIQVPFDRLLPNSWATLSARSGRRGDTSQNVGLSGTALIDNNLSYNLQQNHTRGQSSSGSMSSDYKGTYGQASAGYNYGGGAEQITYGAQGGVLVHPYGVTFSQPLSDTAVLVRAPRAKGVKVQNNTGVYTDWRGYAVVPYVSTYRKNRIALDAQSLDDGVDIETNTQTVIPTQGAVVLADFVTRVGRRVIITLRYQDKAVPFGATAIVVEEGNPQSPNIGIVGGDGDVYLSGVPDKGQLTVQWGTSSNQRCVTDFVLPAAVSLEGTAPQVQTLTARCR